MVQFIKVAGQPVLVFFPVVIGILIYPFYNVNIGNLCVSSNRSTLQDIPSVFPERLKPPGLEEPTKVWWAKEITPLLHVAGRLSERQIMYAGEAGFKSIISLFLYPDDSPGDCGGEYLPVTSEEKNMVEGHVNSNGTVYYIFPNPALVSVLVAAIQYDLSLDWALQRLKEIGYGISATSHPQIYDVYEKHLADNQRVESQTSLSKVTVQKTYQSIVVTDLLDLPPFRIIVVRLQRLGCLLFSCA
ncbi:hypothetical protein ElyMa_000246500 [Elysia marginata]|uniref:Uncharacterized protein n=1 Tax=Elysia marginata TaxID=1093978 RepID=A0AAV4F1L6_9GAST|nr:hypothetical protein ElyMa_000246500 [Elysia marginata]